MKIRAIELTNLRRFGGQRARIDGIGDGISVLAEPNEFGKSTFFDGLYALFFQPHRGRNAPIKALQPHSGGGPEVAVEIELPTGSFRLEKRWLSRPTARVLDGTGRLLAQEDEAEAWIDRLTGQGLAGPSGLLWVRQGLLGLEPEGASAAERSERERGLSARRDLLSSVAGEIETMTGGRRMDQVLARVSEALARLATATQRPKAGGDWARAADEAAQLAAKRSALEEKTTRLTGELRQRSSLHRALQTLTDPETRAKAERDLDAARQALAAAERHAEQTRQAENELRLAQLTAAQSATEMRRLEALRDRLAQAETHLSSARAAFAKATALAETAATAEAEAAQGHDAAELQLRALTQRKLQAHEAKAAQTARDKAEALAAVLERAIQHRQKRDETRAAQKALKITPALMEAVDAALAHRDRLLARRDATLVAVSLAYQGDLRVSVAGEPLAAEGLRLRGRTTLALPGIGTMTIDPGSAAEAGGVGQLAQAEAALRQALAAAGADDPPAARRALSQMQALNAADSHASEWLATLAPAGIDALQIELAQAQHQAAAAAQDPTADASAAGFAALETALSAATEAAAQSLALRREATARNAALRESRAAAQGSLAAATQAMDAIQAEAGDPVELAARLLNLSAAQPALDHAEATAAASLAKLRSTAPDLATARAAADRLQSALQGQLAERNRLEAELAGINGSIGALADEGIEEALDEIRGREATALARAARYEREVKALVRLRDALEAARREARDTYFGPVLRELNPLLSILHPGAALLIDDESLLPVALSRDGQAEQLDILSGGTREQLAILTRLAFARLFARAGRDVPVILDDALVHSDDERIEAMFTALHRVARDQQILVLTCRQRAFAALGGARLHPQITSA